jgi:hypothetical protein
MALRMKGVVLVLAGVAAVGAITACGGGQGSISGPQATQYTLTTIDGHALPHQTSQSSDGTVTTVVNDMLLTVVDDRSWHSVGHQTVSTNGVPSVEVFRDNGTYATSTVPGANETAFRDTAGDLVWVGSITEREVSLAGADSLRWVFDR